MAERSGKSSSPTAAQRASRRDAEVVAEIEVIFSRQPAPSFEFAGIFYGGGGLDPDGTITIPETSARLTFNLSQLSDAVEFEGIQLGWFGPPMSDTGGGRYPMPEHPGELPAELPFVVSCITDEQERKRTLILEDLHDPPCTVVAYQISLRDEAGRLYRHDPKIYNKGPGDGG